MSLGVLQKKQLAKNLAKLTELKSQLIGLSPIGGDEQPSTRK